MIALHDLRRYTQYRYMCMHMYAGPLTPRHKCAVCGDDDKPL